ncbi:DUF11 domain-containing protein [Neorhodopirellula pilleata]|uniref:Large cysteine-rich periplasmic protein OmcB n=1 Tax=Neorhodopirellula pilleata TaxID=2714738 RepID=A0A5C6AU73_9BACT|nr:DUF11 domain-containing protein [Neorhodopirellula pilleata]TWU03290.1 Large cysteine-rich periplasmic protein OmcB precursor [Neorhodopirellula pilleata]
MNDFFKRLSWRLTGGIVTIGLGAFAAAQAQRQEIVDETPLPAMQAPAWSDSLPIPIQAGPEQAQYDSFAQGSSADDMMGPSTMGPSVMPAAFNTDAWNPPGSDTGGALVTTVNHEAPVDQESATANQQPSETQPPSFPAMSMPQAVSMPLPDASAPQVSAPQASGVQASGDQVADSGPSMIMPAMGMPSGDATTQADSMQEADSFDPAALAPAPMSEISMSEIQFDQGPDVSLQPSMEPSNTLGPPRPSRSEPAYESAESAPAMGLPMNNSLRAGPAPQYEEPAPQYGDSAPQYQGQAQLDMPLPSLPQPQAMPAQQAPYRAVNQAVNETNNSYTEPARYPNEVGSSYQANPPARLAGHQTMGLPGGADPRASGNSGYDNARYADPNGDSIAVSIPGDRRLEGVQTPSVVIHKRAPSEVKVGRPATFVVQVRNVGSAEALGVQVHDRIPAGMELIEATPAPIRTGDLLTWDLGPMPIGDERSITMQLIAREEGELGSVARVTFEAAASVRTRSTRPELKIVQRAPQKVLIGQQLEIELEISNVGTGEATGVILQEDVPQGLDHPRGRQLDNALGTLRPGESRREILRLRAVQPGMIRNVVHLVAEDAQEVTDSVDVEVVAPSLGVQLAGPSRRFLERQATYMVNIENNGTAPATNVEVIAYLDRGFTFVSTENNGHYDSNRHAVLWSIVNLPPGDAGSVPLTLLPVEEGDQAIRLEAVADLETRAQSESTVSVQSQAELSFSIADTADPIELGSETTYEIRVKNAGSRNDTNVQVRLVVPPGIELLQSDAEVQTDGRGGLTFAPHGNLPAGGDLVYRVRVRGTQPNTHIIKAIVTSDQARVPVTKEESTMVYEDR